MKLVGREVLGAFVAKHQEARDWIASWVAEVEGAAWMSPHDVKARYASVSIMGGNRAIFNVKGNSFRLEVVIAYKAGIVHAVWAGTHAEYSKR